MVEFIMLAGLPASGKSTYAVSLERDGFKIHSSDALRKELFGDEDTQCDPAMIFDTLNSRIRKDLKEGRSCVCDATNLKRNYRMHLLNQIKGLDVKKTCILFLLPVEECIKRNAERKRSVPERTFDKMLKRFQCPYYYEGWDHIGVFYSSQCKYHYPIEAAYIFDQQNSHHSKKLFNHMHDSAVYVAEQPKGCTQNLFEAALNHDIGKLYTQDFHDSKGNPSAEAHYYHHENYGAYLYLLSEFYSISNPEADVNDPLYVACLINWHMRPCTAWDKSEKAREKDRKLIGEKMYQDILLLHEADKASH